jgi:hypothetical protein
MILIKGSLPALFAFILAVASLLWISLSATVAVGVSFARPAQEMRMSEVFIRAVQQAPPTAKTSFLDSPGEVGIQNDPIHATVAAFQKILIMLAELIPHGASVFQFAETVRQIIAYAGKTATSWPDTATARRATFSAPSRRKSVVPISSDLCRIWQKLSAGGGPLKVRGSRRGSSV